MEKNQKATIGDPNAGPGNLATKDIAQQLPTVGRTVHYYLPNDNRPVAAIITDVTNAPDGVVDLMLLGRRAGSPNNLRLETSVPIATTPLPGHWTWPARS